MPDLVRETNLEDLRRELNGLTVGRSRLVAAYLLQIREIQDSIRTLNREYDRRALALHRKIKALSPPEEIDPITTLTPVRHVRRKRAKALDLTGTEGWSPEDVEHYRQLASN